MTGESLINGTYDVVAKRFEQGALNGLDSIIGRQGVLELVAVAAVCALLIALYMGIWKRR